MSLIRTSLALLLAAGVLAVLPGAAPVESAAPASSARYLVRPVAGQTVIAGRPAVVRAFLYNDLMPGPTERRPGRGVLRVTIEPIDTSAGALPVETVTVEITQGRLKWRGVIPPAADPLALFRGPTWGADGVRTFAAGSRVNMTITIRARGRDSRVTLRNIRVDAVY